MDEVGGAFRAPRLFLIGAAGGSAALQLFDEAGGSRLLAELRQQLDHAGCQIQQSLSDVVALETLGRSVWCVRVAVASC